MSEVKHTPTPWKVVSDPHFDSGLVYTSIQPVNVDADTMKPLAMMNGEHHICNMSHTAAEWRFNYHRANAAFIVLAVNSYHASAQRIGELEAENARLLGSLKDIRGTIKNARNAIESDQVVDKDVHGTLSRCIRKIDAALSPEIGGDHG